MKVINFYDTETTGFGTLDKIINIGMFFVNYDEEKDTMTPITSKDIFNLVDVPIQASAEAKHKISQSVLFKKSGGKRAEDNSSLVKECFDLSDTICAYNKAFDKGKIASTYGIDIEQGRPEEQTLDLMLELVGYFGKRKKQSYALEHFMEDNNYSQEQFDLDFIKDTGSEGSVTALHNALYDAYCLARIFAWYLEVEWCHDS